MLRYDDIVDDPEDILDVWRLPQDNLVVVSQLMVDPESVSLDVYRLAQDSLEAARKHLAEIFSSAEKPVGAIRLRTEENGWLEIAWSVDGRFD